MGVPEFGDSLFSCLPVDGVRSRFLLFFYASLTFSHAFSFLPLCLPAPIRTVLCDVWCLGWKSLLPFATCFQLGHCCVEIVVYLSFLLRFLALLLGFLSVRKSALFLPRHLLFADSLVCLSLPPPPVFDFCAPPQDSVFKSFTFSGVSKPELRWSEVLVPVRSLLLRGCFFLALWGTSGIPCVASLRSELPPFHSAWAHFHSSLFLPLFFVSRASGSFFLPLSLALRESVLS